MVGHSCDQVVSWSKFPSPLGPRQWDAPMRIGSVRRRIKTERWGLSTGFGDLIEVTLAGGTGVGNFF